MSSPRRTTSSKSPQASSVQPWHIAILAIALILGVWQIGRVVVSARAASDVKVGKPAEAPKPPSGASQKTIDMIRDKDSDSDN